MAVWLMKNKSFNYFFKNIFKIPENYLLQRSHEQAKKYFFNIKEYTVAKHSSIN